MKFLLAQNEKHALLGRTILALAFILIAALRVAPHPWNFTPIGAMALFSGAVLKDRRLAFGFPLLALFAGDLFTGLYNYRLMLIVYASFALSVAIGFWLRDRRTVARISAATLAGASSSSSSPTSPSGPPASPINTISTGSSDAISRASPSSGTLWLATLATLSSSSVLLL